MFQIMTFIFTLLVFLVIEVIIVLFSFSPESQFFGAFWGAFFAFFFIVIAQIFKIYYLRLKNNYNAIVELQQELVRFIHAIESNSREIEGILSGFDSDKKQFTLYFFQPRKIEIDKSILLKITKLCFVQDTLNLFLELESLNHIINATKELNDALRESYKVGSPIPAELISSRKTRLSKTLEILSKQLEKVYVLIAKARVLAKKNEARYWLKFDNKVNYSEEEKNLFEIEREKIDKEIKTFKDRKNKD